MLLGRPLATRRRRAYRCPMESWRASAVLSPFFEFTNQFAEAGILADRIEIVVLMDIAEIAITEFERLAKSADGQLRLLEQRVTAGEVVVRQRIARPKLNDLPLH